MTSRIFPSCQQQNHEILRDGEICNACGSPPWRSLPSFSASSSAIRRPQQPQIMQAPDPAIFTSTATNPPTLGLASHLISSGGGRRGTLQQRVRMRPTLSGPGPSTSHSASSSAPSSTLSSTPPSAPTVEQRIVFYWCASRRRMDYG